MGIEEAVEQNMAVEMIKAWQKEKTEQLKNFLETTEGKKLMIDQSWDDFFGYSSKVTMEERQFEPWPVDKDWLWHSCGKYYDDTQKDNTKTDVLEPWSEEQIKELTSNCKIQIYHKPIVSKDTKGATCLDLDNNVVRIIEEQKSGYQPPTDNSKKSPTGNSKDNKKEKVKVKKTFDFYTGRFQVQVVQSLIDCCLRRRVHSYHLLAPKEFVLTSMPLRYTDKPRLKVYFGMFGQLACMKPWSVVDEIFNFNDARTWAWQMNNLWQRDGKNRISLMFEYLHSIDYRACELYHGAIVEVWLDWCMGNPPPKAKHWLSRGSILFSESNNGLDWFKQHSGLWSGTGDAFDAGVLPTVRKLTRMTPRNGCLPQIKLIGFVGEAIANLYSTEGSVNDSILCIELVQELLLLYQRSNMAKISNWMGVNMNNLLRHCETGKFNPPSAMQKILEDDYTLIEQSFDCLAGAVYGLCNLGYFNGQKMSKYIKLHKVWCLLFGVAVAAIIDSCHTIENCLGHVHSVVCQENPQIQVFDFGMLCLRSVVVCTVLFELH